MNQSGSLCLYFLQQGKWRGQFNTAECREMGEFKKRIFERSALWTLYLDVAYRL